MYSVLFVKKQERETNRKYSSDRNLKNRLLKMVRDDDRFSEDEIPIRRTHSQKYTRDDITETRKSMRFKGDFVNVENKT